MSVPQLRAGLSLPGELSEFFDRLIAQKAVTKELGGGPRSVLLDQFIEQEMALARENAGTPSPIHPSLIDEANAIFRDLVYAR